MHQTSPIGGNGKLSEVPHRQRRRAQIRLLAGRARAPDLGAGGFEWFVSELATAHHEGLVRVGAVEVRATDAAIADVRPVHVVAVARRAARVARAAAASYGESTDSSADSAEHFTS
jgi:hypothetical protein